MRASFASWSVVGSIALFVAFAHSESAGDEDDRARSPRSKKPSPTTAPATGPTTTPAAPESAGATGAIGTMEPTDKVLSIPMEPEPTRKSVSCGSANRGALSGAARMPRSGRGFYTPDPWWERGHRHGTDELVSLIERAASLVDEIHPGAILGVADLSAAEGGAIPGHRSHQSGRDADLIFYALDPNGQPFKPDRHMGYYSSSGRARYAKAPIYTRDIPERFFDMARNWTLVKALMDDAQTPVEHIFVSHRVRRWLIRYAESVGEPEDTVARARKLLKRPQSTGGHNDHMHIRISCTDEDKLEGRCKNHIARKRGRRKFYSRVRCPVPPPVEPSE